MRELKPGSILLVRTGWKESVSGISGPRQGGGGAEGRTPASASIGLQAEVPNWGGSYATAANVETPR